MTIDALLASLPPENVYEDVKPFRIHEVMRGEFEALGCTASSLGPFLVIEKNGRSLLLNETTTSYTSLLGSRLVKNKFLTSRLLARRGLSVAKQVLFEAGMAQQAFLTVAPMGRAVIKPVDGNNGRGVSVDVTSRNFQQAWTLAWRETASGILVESMFTGGMEARYLLIDGTCVAVVLRLPPFVTGDGRKTILQLITEKSERRRRHPALWNMPLALDDQRRHALQQAGTGPGHVLEEGRVLVIDNKAGLSTGGEPMDITDLVHPQMKRIAEEAARITPGLDVLGIDILCADHARAPGRDGYIIIEVNTRPGISGHVFPSYGKPRNVTRLIADSCLSRLETDHTA